MTERLDWMKDAHHFIFLTHRWYWHWCRFIFCQRSHHLTKQDNLSFCQHLCRLKMVWVQELKCCGWRAIRVRVSVMTCDACFAKSFLCQFDKRKLRNEDKRDRWRESICADLSRICEMPRYKWENGHNNTWKLTRVVMTICITFVDITATKKVLPDTEKTKSHRRHEESNDLASVLVVRHKSLYCTFYTNNIDIANRNQKCHSDIESTQTLLSVINQCQRQPWGERYWNNVPCTSTCLLATLMNLLTIQVSSSWQPSTRCL